MPSIWNYTSRERTKKGITCSSKLARGGGTKARWRLMKVVKVEVNEILNYSICTTRSMMLHQWSLAITGFSSYWQTFLMDRILIDCLESTAEEPPVLMAYIKISFKRPVSPLRRSSWLSGKKKSRAARSIWRDLSKFFGSVVNGLTVLNRCLIH